jgi:L,D-peptidoglycan transpeptidase YkuD (ErfK/YbiS/YcfS/YnhG family)
VPHRRLWPLLAVGLVLSLTATLAEAPAAAGRAGERPPYHPSRLAHLGDSRQVLVVTAASWSTSKAWLRTYRKGADGRWHLNFGPMHARLGYSGLVPAAQRRQRTGKTPAGTFRLPRAFGSFGDPGTALPYRRFDRNDWWTYDPRSPRTYNVYQRRRIEHPGWRRGWAEHLWDFRGQYRYSVVLDFNLPSGLYESGGQWYATQTADTRLGGGIFLHVNGDGATAGCVSVAYRPMHRILRWLKPDRRPRIVIGPRSAITRM